MRKQSRSKGSIRRIVGGLLLSILAISCGDQPVSDRVDSDGDGWTDRYEEIIGTNPHGADPDSDGDGLPDDLERRLGTLETNPDSDGDGIPDGKEDFDDDGLPTDFELKVGSDPNSTTTDVDGDGEADQDGWEDQDGDGLIDWLEFVGGTDPFKTDTDGDGLDDLEESHDPNLDGTKKDSDGDGIDDGEDPFHTPDGCADEYSGVRHAYNTCINGEFHTRTVRYYVRSCPGEPTRVMTVIEQDVPTGQPCDERVTPPPPLSDVQP